MSSFCSACGRAVSVGAGFCSGCGAPVHRQPAASAYGHTPYHDRNPDYRSRVAREVSGLGWMIEPLRRYADFNGRSRRMEYWMFALLNVIIYLLCFALMIAALPWQKSGGVGDGDPGPVFFVGIGLMVLWWLASLIPSLAVKVRRLHDSDKSGWLVVLFVFLFMIFSIFGWIVEAVFMLLDGTPGPNRYGDDPKGSDVGDIFG